MTATADQSYGKVPPIAFQACRNLFLQ